MRLEIPRSKTDLSSKVACVLDQGLFFHIAEKIAEDFGTVYYWSPWANAFPKSRVASVGSGFENVTRITDYWPHFHEIDVWIVPDVYCGGFQQYLRSIGKRVFGGGMGEELELDRIRAKETLRELGLPVAPYREIIGLDSLTEYLQKNEDKWIKTSRWRGDFETFHHENFDITEVKLKKIAHDLGPIAESYRFVVEDPIEPAIEIGFDGICVDGQYNDPSLFGLEIKDLGFVGKIKPYADLPEAIKWVNEKLRPFMEQHQYRGFFSSELRIKPNGTPYLIDPCCRCASPPGELYCEMYDNLAEMIWYASEGIIIPPKPKATYGVEVMLHSQWADKEWMPVFVDEDIQSMVKLRNRARFGGRDYSVPLDYNLPEFGAVIGMENTLQGAIDNAMENCELVTGIDVVPKCESIDKALEEIDKLEKLGINFH